MSESMTGAAAIVLLTVFLTSLLLRRAPIVRFVAHTIRNAPRGHRAKASRIVLGAVFGRRNTPPKPRTPGEAAFRLPDGPVRTVPYEQWQRVDTLIANARNVTTIESNQEAVSLDTDGSVVVVRYRDDTTSDIGVPTPDGSLHAVTGPDGVESTTTPRPSIDNGTIAWWQTALDGKSATIWVARRGSPPRALRIEPLPHGKPRPWEPYGWVVVAGDWVVWTLLTRDPKRPGAIVATAMDGHTYHLGTTRFVTLHRDRGAEREGRGVVAFNLAEGEMVSLGQVAEVDLNGPVPAVRILRAGAHPGASVCNGAVVGYWSAVRAVQLPGGVWVTFGVGTSASASDIFSDGEWCAGRVFNPVDALTKNVSVSELFHVPSGTRQRLSESPSGIVDIRGHRVLRAWAPRDKLARGRSSWTGELLAPPAASEA